MVLTTIVLAAALAGTPAKHTTKHSHTQAAKQRVVGGVLATHITTKQLAIDLHAMTDDEKRLYPGRENWDKTEWYESQFKSAKTVVSPEHVDEWHNGGRDQG